MPFGAKSKWHEPELNGIENFVPFGAILLFGGVFLFFFMPFGSQFAPTLPLQNTAFFGKVALST